ncbi:MAG: 7-cyano-7-deazaguanine synthase [Methanothermobacter sp.]|nr:7-cyano-7-deazaguanine synthase [Methanothermobacter sp.]
MESSYLKKMIEELRAEIGHERVDVNIKEAIFNKEKDELIIIAPDRSDKSVIIGKGGWVAGRLKEALGVGRVHVEAYTDILLKRYRMKLSLDKIESLIKKGIFSDQLKVFRDLLQERLGKIPEFDLLEYKIEDLNGEIIVALSGGVDSSFSAIIAKNLGFNVKAVTVDPGSIILPRHVKENIKRLSKILKIKHEYIKADFSDIIKEALEGRFHPCGRCSKKINDKIIDYVRNQHTKIVIFGDLLPTSSQAVNLEDGILRLNLPALLAASKQEVKSVVSRFNIKGYQVFGCPLLGEVHKKFPHLRQYSIQRILRETRAGILEPGEALTLIMGLFKEL